MYFQGRLLKKEDYCNCHARRTITSLIEDMGYWDICCQCGKPIEDGFHYYNHYDGEDHDEELY
jgi:hypothetical protein